MLAVPAVCTAGRGAGLALPWLLAIFLELGELRGGVAPGAGAPFWLEESGVSNRRKSVLQEEHGWQGAAGPQWEGDCEDQGEWEGGFLAQERRGTAQAVTVDLGHGQAEDRTGWECGFAHFWYLSEVYSPKMFLKFFNRLLSSRRQRL